MRLILVLMNEALLTHRYAYYIRCFHIIKVSSYYGN